MMCLSFIIIIIFLCVGGFDELGNYFLFKYIYLTPIPVNTRKTKFFKPVGEKSKRKEKEKRNVYC